MQHDFYCWLHSRIGSTLFGSLLICTLLTGCADFRAQYWSTPPQLVVMPFPDLTDLATDRASDSPAADCKMESVESDEPNKKECILNYLDEKNKPPAYLNIWRNNAFRRAALFNGWEPDYCNLVKKGKEPRFVSLLNEIDPKVFYERFWRMNRSLWPIRGTILDPLDPKIVDETKKKIAACPFNDTIDPLEIKVDSSQQPKSGFKIPPPVWRELLGRIDLDHKALLLPILNKRESSIWHRLAFWRTPDFPGQSVLERLAFWKTPSIPAWQEKRDAWQGMRSNDNRDVTVSTDRPASVSVTSRRLAPKDEDKSPVFSLAAEGQQGFMDLVKNLMIASEDGSKLRCQIESQASTNQLANAKTLREPRCNGQDAEEKECQPQPPTPTALQCKDQEATVKRLLELVQLGGTKDEGLEKFTPKQTVELTISSALNSPDITNRFDYIATYLYVYPYPRPIHPLVSMEEEFWERFRSLHAHRSEPERTYSIAADLDAAWRSLQVYFDNLETTVATHPIQEIASITRKADSGIELKSLKPSVTLSGTVKGSVEAEGGFKSGIATDVTEKLVKQLDQRTTWLSTERDLLRITQRGTDAVNPSGSIRENVTLHIPQSAKKVYLSELSEPDKEQRKQLKLGEMLTYPVYANVSAFAVSLAVVREPFSLKRSATEKFGLPDSADAYLVVTVSNLDHVPLWSWGRTVYPMTIDDLDIKEHPKLDAPESGSGELLMIQSPGSSKGKLFMVKTENSTKVRVELQQAVLAIKDKAKTKSLCDQAPRGDSPTELSICVQRDQAKNAGQPGYYLVANHSKNVLDDVWIGKMKKGKWHHFECTDLVVLKSYLIENQVCPAGPN